MIASLLFIALGAQAHAPAEPKTKPEPAWISVGPRGENKGSNAELLAAIKTMLGKKAECRDFNPAGGAKPAPGWKLCRSAEGWKEKDPAKRAPLKKKLTAAFAKNWTLSFSDGVRSTDPKEKQRQRKAVEAAGKGKIAPPHGAVIAKYAGGDSDLRDGLGAMVTLQARDYGRRNPAGISRLHGKVKGPEDSIRIGARLWKDYRSTLERRNGDLFDTYKDKGEAALLVALAYRFGPGRVLKWAKGATLSLPKEAARFADSYMRKFSAVKGAITRSIAPEPAAETKKIPIPVRRPARKVEPAPKAALTRGLTPVKQGADPKPVVHKQKPVIVKPEPRLPRTTIRGAAGKLNLRNLATGERIAISYNGSSLNANDRKAFNRILRDKSGRSTNMSPALLNILAKIQARYPGKTISIVSGFRSPEYNAALRRASMKRNGGKSGVAKNSRHMHADAADIVVEGVSIKELNAYARSLKMGGVGYYPGDWVHVDAGRVRYW